jgi:HD superfamily phosphohydrolase YqeK
LKFGVNNNELLETIQEHKTKQKRMGKGEKGEI